MKKRKQKKRGGEKEQEKRRGKECSVDEGENEGKHKRGGKENRRYRRVARRRK